MILRSNKTIALVALFAATLCGCNTAKQTTDTPTPAPQGSAPLAGNWTITFGMGGPDNQSMNVTAVTTASNCPDNWDQLTNYPPPAYCAVATTPALSPYGSGWTDASTPTELIVGSNSSTVAEGDQFYFALVINAGQNLDMEGTGTWTPNTNPPSISGSAQCTSYSNETACADWQSSKSAQATFGAFPSNQN